MSHGHAVTAPSIYGLLAEFETPTDLVTACKAAYAEGYREGSGEGVRYTAFDRYTKLAEQSLSEMQRSQTQLAGFLAQA